MTTLKRLRWTIAAVGVAVASWLLMFGLPPASQFTVDDLVRYDCLSHAQWFAGPAVGIGGVEPAESKALRALASHHSGGRAFKYLLFTGTTAGKMYALVGLRQTNPLFFRIAVQPFRIWPGDVATFFGCIVQTIAVRELVETRGANPVRLAPGETLNQWWKHRKPGVEVNIDILGGGYTSMFVDLAELTRPSD
jgi:hypothetical protein